MCINTGTITMNKSYFLERLLVTKPEAEKLYDYSYIPNEFLATEKITIVCKIHGIFRQSASAHIHSAGCPKCAICRNTERQTLTTDEFIRRSRARFGERFDYSETVYKGKDVPLLISCREHGRQLVMPADHYVSKYGCLECSVEKPRALKRELAIRNAKLVHGDKYDYSKVVFVNMSTKVEICCAEHGYFWQAFYEHISRGTGCPKCAVTNDKLTFNEFVRRSRVIHGERYSYIESSFKYGGAPTEIVCSVHGSFMQRAKSHLAGNGCLRCYIESTRLPLHVFISKAKEIHGDKYDYSGVHYLGGKIPVEVLCPVHGMFLVRPNSHISSKQGCGRCNESRGELAVNTSLEKHRVNFVREYRIKPYLYRFDFFLPDYGIYIEFHGHQHFRPVEFFGGEEEFLKTRERDIEKQRLVTERGEILIVLTYLNLIENSVESVLIEKLKLAGVHL